MEEVNVEKLIVDRYKVLPAEVKELFHLNIVERTLRDIVLNHSLNEAQRTALENRLYLILLLFLPSTNLAEQVAEVLEMDDFRATIIANHLQSEIFDLIDDLLEATNEKFLLSESQSNNGPSQVTAVNIESLQKVSPFRTMEGDAKKIHGYGAFRNVETVKEDQPVYRSEQAKLIPPPAYTDDSSTPKAS